MMLQTLLPTVELCREWDGVRLTVTLSSAKLQMSSRIAAEAMRAPVLVAKIQSLRAISTAMAMEVEASEVPTERLSNQPFPMTRNIPMPTATDRSAPTEAVKV